MVLMANRYILPAALEYQRQIGQSVAAAKAGGVTSGQGKKLLSSYSKLVDKFKIQSDALAGLLTHSGGSSEKHAKYMRDKVIPAMVKLRETGDQIEVLTPHGIWPRCKASSRVGARVTWNTRIVDKASEGWRCRSNKGCP